MARRDHGRRRRGDEHIARSLSTVTLVTVFTKERPAPEPGSLADLLAMFENELRFYREIASEVGVRVPACREAVETNDGFRLVLEDLSAWREGGDPVQVACVLRELHQRWKGRAEDRWPWLQRAGKAAEAIGELYDCVWAGMQARGRRSTATVTRPLCARLHPQPG